MKKLISLMLAVLMITLCACGFAEETDVSAKTAFVQIKEGVTAQVFKKPGDKKAVDTLSGGQICELLGEETTETGVAWFQVFYLNSKKAGTPGYINAEDAEQLTEEQLKALMNDPEKLNEILDLVEALDVYLGKKSGNGETGGTDLVTELKSLYKQAANELEKLLNTSVTPDLDKLEKQGKELADKAKAAAEDLKDDVIDTLAAMDGKETGEQIDILMDSISDAIEKRAGVTDEKINEALDKVSSVLKELDTHLGEGTGNAIDSVASTVKDTKSWLDGKDFGEVNSAMKELAEKFKNNGFVSGAGSGGFGAILEKLQKIFPKK